MYQAVQFSKLFRVNYTRKDQYAVLKIRKILKEVMTHLALIWTVARYNNKATFQGHYFGIAWEIINPLIQISLYFFVFGAIRDNNLVRIEFAGNSISIQFLPWMLVGMAAWMFMNRATLSASQSVQKKIGLVSKMQFPISILPAMDVAAKLVAYFITTLIVIAIIIIAFSFTPTIFWLQYFYYLIAMLIFVYFFALLNSTLTIMFRDYHQILKPIMQLFFWFSGVIWRVHEMRSIPNWLVRLMDLNPFSYILTGFRYTFFSQAFFWEHWETTVFFWLLILVLAIVSSHLHLKLRSKFIDLV